MVEKNKFPQIILINPQLPENIGMSARAMMNCGFQNLRIVNPREKWPNESAIKSSAHAKNIIKKSKVFNNIEEATSDLEFIIATSVRKRFARKKHFFDFNSLMRFIPNKSKVGIIFGPENSGLNNEDISKCNCIFSLPMENKDYSLNLAHSVLLVCYEFGRIKKNQIIEKENYLDIGSRKEFNALMDHLYEDLIKSGFLYPIPKRKVMFNNIRNMFLRSNFSSQEIKTFRGILTKLKKN